MFDSKTFTSEFMIQNNLKADAPPADSFFFKAFEQNISIARQTLNTSFIQGIKNGNLNPDSYGAFTVLDSYYCYHCIRSFQTAINHAACDPELKQLLTSIMKSYQSYNKILLDDWHIQTPDGIKPTEAMYNYVEADGFFSSHLLPIYTLVAMIPCYYLWYWISDNIYKHKQNNLYSGWIESSHSTDSAYAIGNFIETRRHGNTAVFDDSLALMVYKANMEAEYLIFQEACK